MGLALSCCKRTLFRLTNAGYLSLIISWTHFCCWEWNPHRLHAHLEQTPSDHTTKIPLDTQHYFRAKPIFFNDDFGRLTGTEPLFQGVWIVIIDPFFIICDNSLDKSIIHRITDKLMADIHSTLSLLRCQFMRYSSTTSLWFSKCLNQVMYGIFWCTKFFWQFTCIFCGFPYKPLHIFSISHNLGLPERGKSSMFSSPVLKHWNHRCATQSLMTPSPSSSHIPRAAASAL